MWNHRLFVPITIQWKTVRQTQLNKIWSKPLQVTRKLLSPQMPVIWIESGRWSWQKTDRFHKHRQTPANPAFTCPVREPPSCNTAKAILNSCPLSFNSQSVENACGRNITTSDSWITMTTTTTKLATEAPWWATGFHKILRANAWAEMIWKNGKSQCKKRLPCCLVSTLQSTSEKLNRTQFASDCGKLLPCRFWISHSLSSLSEHDRST